MTKAELQASHDAMVKFLTSQCRRSDRREDEGCLRMPLAERQYQRAKALLEKAGSPMSARRKSGNKKHANDYKTQTEVRSILYRWSSHGLRPIVSCVLVACSALIGK